MTDEVILDAQVVARILRRANDLTASQALPDQSSGVSESALLAAADELGLSLDAVRRSIAVEQLGPVPKLRAADRLLGPKIVVIDDEIAGSSGEVLARLDAWLVDGHHMRRDRLRTSSGEWSRRGGPAGVAIRSARAATGEGRLGTYQRIKAAARDGGSGSTVVRVAVHRERGRHIAAGGGALVAAGGAAVVAIGAFAASPFVLLATPIAVLAGVGVASAGRGRANRAALEVERVLESVHQGQSPTKLRVDLAKRVTGLSRRLDGRPNPPN
jgi:hypothetical protein